MKFFRSTFFNVVLLCCFIAPAVFAETSLDPSQPFIVASALEVKVQGVAGGNAPDASFALKNGGAGTLNFTVRSKMPWVEVSPSQGTSTGGVEQKINLHFKTSDLKEGQYVAPIVIESANAQNSPRTVFVRLDVLPKAVIVLSAQNLMAKVQEGKAPEGQTFMVQNQGAGTLSYTIETGYMATDETGWLSLVPGRGEIPGGQQAAVKVNFNASKLSAGMHIVTLAIKAPGAVNSPQHLQVNVQVMSNKTLSLGVKKLDLESDGKPSGVKVFRMENTGSEALNYEIKSKDPWLKTMPLNGTLGGGQEAAISVQYDTSKLKPGVYESEIEVRQKGSSEVEKIPVKLEVSGSPVIGFKPTQLNLKATAGKESSEPTALNITNEGDGKLEYVLTADVPWLGMEPSRGVLEKGKSDVIAVSVTPGNLAAGEHKAVILVTAPGAKNDPQKVSVKLTLEATSRIAISPETLSVETKRGTDALAGAFEVTNSGTAPFVFTIKTKEDWLKVEPAQGTITPGENAAFQVTYKTKDLSVGDYDTNIEISDPKAKMSEKLPVRLMVKSKTPKQAATSGTGPCDYQVTDDLWEVSSREDATYPNLIGSGTIPGALQGLFLNVGNVEKQNLRLQDTVRVDDSWGVSDVVILRYKRAQEMFVNDPRYGPRKIPIWDIEVEIHLYSPRGQWAGFYQWMKEGQEASIQDNYKYGYRAAAPVKGADESYVAKQVSDNFEQGTSESWKFSAVKDGAVINMWAYTSKEALNLTKRQMDFYPFMEQLLSEVSNGGWRAVFKKGNPRFDRLPNTLKPLIMNIGTLPPQGIFFWDTKKTKMNGVSLGYHTESLHMGSEDKGSWRWSVFMNIYYPFKEGSKQAKDTVEIRSKSPLEGETISRVNWGDAGYKEVGKDPDYIKYEICVGPVFLELSFQAMNKKFRDPPEEWIRELVGKIREVDYDELFASLDKPSEIPYEEEQLDESAFEEAPPLTLPDDFWDPRAGEKENLSPVSLQGESPRTDSGRPQSGDRNEQGLIWSPVAGGAWVKPEIYESDVTMIREGKVYTDQWGWVSEAEAKEKQAHYQKFQAANQVADEKRQADLQKLSQDIRDTKKAIKDSEAKREKVAQLREKLDQLEENMKEAANDARWNSKATLTNTAQLAAREIVTGADAEGGVSYKAMALRMLMGSVTVGYSEVAYNTADASYQILDHLKNGDSIMGAVAKTTVSMATSEVIGRAQAGLMSWGAKKATTAVRKVFGQAAEAGTEGLSKELAKKKAAVEKALSIKDEVKQADAIKKLYRGGGMDELSQLERSGHLGTNDVKKMKAVISQEINESVDNGVKKTMAEFEEKTGVKIEEVMVGDSGSSATGRITSVNTDADFASLPKFNEAALKNYADKYCGGDLVKANKVLCKKFADANDSFVDASLRAKGLSASDVKYQTYDRFGAEAGPGDSYTAGFVRTRQAAQGKTTVFKAGEEGGIKSYKTSGQAMTDQDLLIRKDVMEKELKRLNEKTEGLSPRETAYMDMKKKDLNKELKKISGEDSPQIKPGEAEEIMKKQEKALSGKDELTAEKASKALERADKALALEEAAKNLEILKTGGKASDLEKIARIDPALLEKAALIRKHPQQVKQILGGMSEEEFIQQVKDAVGDAGQKIKGN